MTLPNGEREVANSLVIFTELEYRIFSKVAGDSDLIHFLPFCCC
jgi:hypothetical protein